MKHKIFKHFILICLFFFPAITAFSAFETLQKPATLAPGAQSVNLAPHMAFYIDSGRKLGIDDVTAQSFQDKFIPNPQPTTPHYLGNKAVWGRIEIQSPLPRKTLYIFMNSYTIKHLDFYLPHQGGFKKITSGYSLPEKERPYFHRKLVIPIKTLHEKRASFQGGTIYFRAYTPEIEYQLNAWLATNYGLARLITFDAALDIVFLTIVIIMAIYNLFIYTTIRDKSYLLYVFYILSFGAAVYTGIGMAQSHFSLTFEQGMIVCSLMNYVTMIAVNLFLQQFLNLKKSLNWVHQLLSGFNYFYLVTGIIYMLSYKPFNDLYNITMVVNSFVILWVGIFLYKRYPYARDFTRAWSILILSNIVYTLVISGVYLPYVTIYTVQAGGAIESVLLAFALGRRVRYLEGDKRQYRKIQRELSSAEKIQKRLFPQAPPASQHYNIAWRYFPSTMLCGDFYDYKSTKGVLSLILTDVAGHGYAASLIASMVKVAFHETFNLSKPLKKQVENINRILCEQIHMVFATALHLRIYPEQKKFHLIRSGHVPLLHYDNQEKQIHSYTPPGAPLGISEKYTCEELVIPYQTGDQLLLFTDGLLEELNKSGEEYGINRLSTLFLQNSMKSPEDLCNQITHEIDQWAQSASHRDDISLLIIELK